MTPEHTDKAPSPLGRKALIIGISGQDGAYLARLLLSKGYEVHGTSRDSEANDFGSLVRLNVRHRVTTHSLATADFRSVLRILTRVVPDEIYNLSGQSSVALSFDLPIETFESIAVSTLTILDALQFMKLNARFFNAASSECFGTTNGPAHEETLFRPRSPYAMAKAASFWAVANYRDSYGMYACSGILGNHESPLRPHRYVTRKIVAAAVAIAGGTTQRLAIGNLEVRRDWGWGPEYVEAMWRMLQLDHPEDCIIATGQTHSLQDFIAAAFAAVGLDWTALVDRDSSLLRPSDIPESALDPSKAARLLGWRATYRMPEVVRLMIEAERSGSIAPELRGET